MKQLVIYILFFLIAVSSFGQRDSTSVLTVQDYLDRSRKQQKIATILLAGGAGLVITSFLIPRGDQVGDDYENDDTKKTFFISGIVAGVSSFPFFILAGKNRRKVNSLGLKFERSQYLDKQSLVTTSFPALRLKINF